MMWQALERLTKSQTLWFYIYIYIYILVKGPYIAQFYHKLI